jgi:perosamine synthetase
MVGSNGNLGVFDFNLTKPLATTGGMVTTDQAVYADRLRILRSEGIRGDPWAHYYSPAASEFYEVYPSFDCRMNRVSVALGREHLRKVSMFHAIRGYYAALYQLGLSDLPELSLPEASSCVEHAWHRYIIRLNRAMLTIDRDAFLSRLRAENIGASYFIPLHLHPYYREIFGYSAGHFPRALAAYQQVIALPLYPGMTEGDVWDVIRAVRTIIERHRVTR